MDLFDSLVPSSVLRKKTASTFADLNLVGDRKSFRKRQSHSEQCTGNQGQDSYTSAMT